MINYGTRGDDQTQLHAFTCYDSCRKLPFAIETHALISIYAWPYEAKISNTEIGFSGFSACATLFWLAPCLSCGRRMPIPRFFLIRADGFARMRD